MTVYSFWQQSLTYPAATVRKLANLFFPDAGDGVLGVGVAAAPLLVQAKTTPDMSVKVNPGFARKSEYLGYSDATANVVVPTANASNPRIDLIVMRWRDTEAGDPSSSCTIELIQGTPAATPTVPSTTGMNVLVLAQIAVAAGTTSISASAITDKRTIVGDTGWLDLPLASGFVQNTTKPQYRIKGGIVYLQGDVKPSSGVFAASSVFTIGTLPVGARPGTQSAADQAISGSGASAVIRGLVTTTGGIQVVTLSATVSVVQLGGLSGYIAEQ